MRWVFRILFLQKFCDSTQNKDESFNFCEFFSAEFSLPELFLVD